MEISRDLQVRAAFTQDVEQYLEPVVEVKSKPKIKGPSWAEELPTKAWPGGAFNAPLQFLKVKLPNEKCYIAFCQLIMVSAC